MHPYSRTENDHSFIQHVASNNTYVILRNSAECGIRFANLSHMKSAIAAVFALFTCIIAQGQSLYSNKQFGPYIHLYQLSNEQAAYAVSHPYQLDSQFLYTQLVGKVRADSAIPFFRGDKNYPYPVQPLSKLQPNPTGYNNNRWNLTRNGYFIEISVYNNQVYYKLIENPIFFASVHRIGYQTFVFVEDSSGLLVNQADVMLDTHHCYFDPSVGGYAIKTSNISGSLRIKRGSDFAYYVVNGYNSEVNYGEVPRDNYQYDNSRIKGYLVTNLPVYKPGDTIFFKSYLVNKKAKPLKYEIIARLSQNATGHAKELHIKPDPRGAYNGFFVTDDSFAAGQPLELYMLTEKRQALINKSLRYENYELKDIVFSLQPHPSEIARGEALPFYINTYNKAGLPILDGSIRMEISLQSIEHSAADSFQISYAKMRKYFVRQVQTDASGITFIEIPADSIPDIKGQWNAHFTLTTADNESFTQTASFSTSTSRNKTLGYVKNDTLTVLNLYENKLVRRKMRVVYYSRYDRIADSTFYTPMRAYLPPNIQYASLYFGDTLFTNLYREVLIPEITGKRSHDSVHIEFHSKHDVPVYYRIYRNNEIVTSGNDIVLNFEAADKSKNSYHIQYGVLAGRLHAPTFFSKSFHLAEKELNIQIVQPKEIYPGQEVAVEIWVKDAYGKPVHKANLTAWAINTQLDDLDRPNLPYMGKVKLQRMLPTVNFGVTQCNINHYHFIKQWELSTFNLLENEFYQLMYPKKGFMVLADTTPDHSTQVVFYNHSKNLQSIVNYASFNDTLVYINGITPQPGVIRVEPGTYTVKLRIPGRIVTLNEVQIQKGKKNFICLHADSLAQYTLGDTLSSYMYSDAEFAMIRRHTMLFRFDYNVYDTLVISENGKKRYANQPYTWNKLQQVYVGRPEYSSDGSIKQYKNMQQFYAYGPLQPMSSINMSWRNNYSHEFSFEPRASVSMTKSDVVMDEANALLKGYQYFQTYNYNPYDFYSFFWDPDFKPSTAVHSVTNPSIRPSEPTYYLEEYQYRSYWPSNQKQSTIHVQLPPNRYAQRIWLFQVQDSAQSFLNNNPTVEFEQESQTYFYRHLPVGTGSENRVGLILVLQEADSIWLVKRLTIDSQSLLCYRLKDSDFRRLRKSEWIAFDRMAKILGREPFAHFEDTPTVSKSLNLIRIPSKDKSTILEGTVNGPELKYVVENAYVILEKNGFFVRGAITNRDGRFRMDSLQAGEYMLKIKGANYHYWLAYNLNLEKGSLHALQVNLKPHSNMLYYPNGTSVYEPKYLMDAAADYDGVDNYASYSGMATSNIDYSIAEVSSKGKYKMVAAANRIRNISSKREKDDAAFDEDDVTDDIKAQGRYQWGFADDNTSSYLDLLNKMSGNETALRIRQNFRDYAYWIPNLNTNKKGYATYAVRFPDNITSWQTWIPGMDGKRHSGLGEITVKSYKPLSTALALPPFLTEEDNLTVYGRVYNYTGAAASGKYTLFIDSQGLSKDVAVGSFYNDSIILHAGAAGRNIQIENGFGMNNGYRDVQRRNILVKSAKVTTGMSSTLVLRRDTSILFKGNRDYSKQTFTLYGNPLSMVQGLLQQRINMLYPDNLSMADELNVLLTEKTVCEATGADFDKDDEIKILVRRIRNAQHGSGLFGTFSGAGVDNNLSTYVAEVMHKANLLGYNNNAWLNVVRYYEKQLPSLYGEEALDALLLLTKLSRPVNHDEFLPRIQSASLSLQGQIKYGLLMGLLMRPVEPKAVLTHLQPSAMGNISVGSDQQYVYKFNPYCDNAATTYMAWEWLRLNNSEPELRKLMAQWMANEAGSSARNIARASTMLLSELKLEYKGELKTNITVNGQIVDVDKTAVTFAVPANDSLILAHSGAEIYVLHRKEWATYTPKSDTTSFTIHHSFERSQTLHEGENFKFKATVFAKRSHGNVVVEIPIPAGVVFAQKNQKEHSFESYREYKEDRVIIYLSQMPFGYTEFHLELLPKFTGTFQIPPARAALLYYPEVAGYTARTSVSIVE